ncbi:hypothetical protein Tco_0862628 [Tanacetum coccineum]
MCTYLKNMAGWKPKDLKNKSFTNIQELFDKAIKMVNTFVDFRIELMEGTEKRKGLEKRTGDELEQENAKKQKVDVEKETEQEKAELQSLMEIVSDEEGVAIDAIPLATKPLSIVDWKILTEGKKSYYHIIRVGGQSKRVHCLTLQSGMIYMLVEKRYPLTPSTITDMLNRKLQADFWNEMCYQLLKLIGCVCEH